jgi:photosystem II CP47 chlorophyll apoprotein
VLYVQTYLPSNQKYSIEQVGVSITFYGGELDGVSFNNPAVKNMLRTIRWDFEFDRSTYNLIVFRSSPVDGLHLANFYFRFIFLRSYLAWCTYYFPWRICGIDEGDEQVEFVHFKTRWYKYSSSICIIDLIN